MASGDERFVRAAHERGLVVDVHRWPEGTRTAADAAAAVGCDVAQIVKSLVFIVDGEPVIVLTSGRNRVDTARLGDLVGAGEVRKANADEAREATGYVIGGTPPLGYPEARRVFIDEDLLEHEVVWAAAGTPDTTFPIAPAELRRAAGALTAAIAER